MACKGIFAAKGGSEKLLVAKSDIATAPPPAFRLIGGDGFAAGL
ncbi:hypothetical protein N9747_10765 [Planktomarina sp.]|jgi:hypothetical protein|nr:hypothetical protein [Planktomarina sp.]|tara:strand:- start:158 stop:289 length:132 start_codon:yes stop_codon:yes gene_type:complete